MASNNNKEVHVNNLDKIRVLFENHLKFLIVDIYFKKVFIKRKKNE